MPTDPDREEIQEEEAEMIDALEAYCRDFEESQQFVPANLASVLATIARRVVFIERELLQAASQAKRRRQRTVNKPCRSAIKVIFLSTPKDKLCND